jgi:hypothetical protein
MAAASNRLAEEFIEALLSESLGALTEHIARCHAVWYRASAALRSDNLDAQNRAIDELVILLREGKW